MDMKLEVVTVPVADVDRAKRFYTQLGWRLDADFGGGPDFRGVQFTPPGSAGTPRLAGPDPERTSYASFATFSDPDGNLWLLQEVRQRLPGR